MKSIIVSCFVACVAILTGAQAWAQAPAPTTATKPNPAEGMTPDEIAALPKIYRSTITGYIPRGKARAATPNEIKATGKRFICPDGQMELIGSPVPATEPDPANPGSFRPVRPRTIVEEVPALPGCDDSGAPMCTSPSKRQVVLLPAVKFIDCHFV